MALADAVVSLNGCWTWFNDPRVVYDAATDTLFIGHIRADGTIYVHGWDRTGRSLTYGTPLSSVLQQDDHSNPALCVLASGKILAAYSQHNGDSYSCRTTNAGDVRTWDSPVALASGSTDDAYAHLFQMGDTAETVYWFFRRGNTNPRSRWFRTSTDDGSTWDTPVEFISEASQRPYLIAAQTSSTRIDFCVSTGQPNEAANSLYHCYMTVASDGTRSYYKSDGTLIGGDAALPLGVSDMTQVYDGTSTDGWQWDIASIGGTLVITYATFESTDTVHRYYQARWSGSAWQSDEICTGGTTASADYLYSSETAYSGGVALDPNDINAVYVSREYGSGDFRLEKWTHTGTFPSGTWAKDSDTSGNTSTVNARPYCPRGLSPTTVLWWEGTYTSYTTFSTRIRMSPAPSWRKAKEASPTWTSGYAPTGAYAYFLLHEGSGTTVNDLANNRDGSITGSPTWNAGASDDFGPFLSAFSTSAYVNIDTLAAALPETTFPLWIAVLFKTTSTGTTQEWSVGIGSTSDNDPIIGTYHNSGSATNIGTFFRDNLGGAFGSADTTVTGINDGEFHVVLLRKVSASSLRAVVDGITKATQTFTTSTTSCAVGAIGALKRASVTGAFTGEIHAVIVGSGSEPDQLGLTLDLLHGQFQGTFDPDAAGGTTYNESLSFTAASSLPISAAATGVAAIGVAAATALSPVSAATVPVGVGLSAAAAAAMSAAASSVAGVGFTSAAAQTHAVTCLSSVAVALSALSALSMSDGSTQNVSEAVSFTATAAQQMTAAAVAEAVQTYLASAGLTHASAATAGAALAISVSAALGQQATMQASATIVLSAAAQLLLASSASGDISYAVLRIAAETLRHASVTGDTLQHAQATGETLQ